MNISAAGTAAKRKAEASPSGASWNCRVAVPTVARSRKHWWISTAKFDRVEMPLQPLGRVLEEPGHCRSIVGRDVVPRPQAEPLRPGRGQLGQ